MWRMIMSVSPGLLLKLPTPTICQSNPTVPMKAVLVIWLLLISSTINPPGLLLRYAGRGGGYRHPPGRTLVITGMAEAARRLPSGDRYCSARHAVRNHVLGSRRR